MKPADIMQKPDLSPDQLYKCIDRSMEGLKESWLIFSAFELGVFEVLKTPESAEVLAGKLGCDPALMPIFCEALCKLGLLSRFEGHESDGSKAEINRKYGNTALASTYLVKDSPFFHQHYLSEKVKTTELWAKLPEIMRKGPVIVHKETFFGERIIPSMAENALTGLLQETVQTVMENVDFSKVGKLLDLGGGHGLYAIAFAALSEELEAFVFDLPAVTEKTRAYIEKYGVNRVDVLPGNFFEDDIGSGYDLIFSSSNPGGKVPELIPKIAAALNEGGIFVNRQGADEKIGSNPLFNLEWNLWTFEDTKKASSGYSFENSVPFDVYIERLGDFGFEVEKIMDMEENSRIVFARKTRKV